MTALQATLAASIDCALGEGPVWDERQQALFFVDINGRRFLRFTPATGSMESFPVPDLVGALALTPDSDRVRLALRGGFATFTLSTGALSPLVVPPEHRPEARFNDCQVDPQGRLWAGTLSLDGASNGAMVYRVGGDADMTPVLRGVGLSNGMGWSPDGRTFHHIDTPTRRVRRFRFEPTDGSIVDLAQDLDLSCYDGVPDGMAVDAQGALWVAFWGGACVRAFDSDSGQLLASVALPVPHVTSCAFGGADLRDLFITSAGAHGEAATKAPLSGSLFRVRVHVPGQPANIYRG